MSDPKQGRSFNALTRREMIAGSGAIILGLAPIKPPWTADSGPGPEEKELIFRTSNPRNAEPRLSDLVRSWITPNKFFYIRSHAPNPELDADSYTLKIDGLVNHRIELRLDDLQRYPQRTITATLTCAGNRRAEFNREARVGGVQWGAGAIGNAEWTGVELKAVLQDAGVQPSARHVWLEGLDSIPAGDGSTFPFGASIPIEKALGKGDTIGALLVTHMNGQPLARDHGYPLRAIVPGYIGARSVKWLGRITLAEHPSPNHYVSAAYKVVTDTEPIDWAEAGPIYRYPINAAIGQPESDAVVPAGKIEVVGYVLPSGKPNALVKAVWVSADGGASWTQAELIGENRPYCWRLWRAEVEVSKNTKELVARAEDTAGGFMPSRVPWNAKGYLQNSWYRMPVRVQ